MEQPRPGLGQSVVLGDDSRPDARSTAYLDAALDAVVMADAAGMVVEFNPSAERTFGYSRAYAVGRPLATLIVPPSLRDRHQRAFSHFVRTGHGALLGQRLELTGMRADGTEFPVELALSMVQVDPLLVCGAIRDLSDSKRTEGNLRRLVDEHAALRRVATIVAGDPSPSEVFDAVTLEASNLLQAPLVGMVRFEPDATATVIASLDERLFPLGIALPLEETSLPAILLETGRPSRVDDYADQKGVVAERLRRAGMRSAVGAPIVVDRATWGALLAVAPGPERLPDDAETRLERFTELVAVAISHMQARDNLSRLVDQQSALRGVATLVARGAEAADVFDAVAEEAGRIVGATSVNLARFTSDGYNLTMAGWSVRDTHVPTGTRLPLEGDTINALIYRTGTAGRIDTYRGVSGELASLIRDRGIVAEVGAPVIVEGEIWGALIAGWDTPDPPPARAEADIASFAELVATAVASAEARAGLHALLEDTDALRRVATLVANRGRPEDVFAAVAEETGRRLMADLTDMWRFDDGDLVFVANWSRTNPVHFPARITLAGSSLARIVRDTGMPSRIDDYVRLNAEDPGPISADATAIGIRAAIGCPIIVDGRLWGLMSACRLEETPFPINAEYRLASFTDLIATAISNAAHHAELLQSRARIVAAGDDARRRIERNLHDGIQQRLVAVGLDLQVLDQGLRRGTAVTSSQIQDIAAELGDVLDDVREISRGLHPAILAEAGLAPALRSLARRSPLVVELDIALPVRPAASTEVAAYYVVAEALANTSKYAQANFVRVSVAQVDDRLSVTVGDDGIGGASRHGGSGLTGLADRVEALGGIFEVISPSGGGTTIVANLPMVGGRSIP